MSEADKDVASGPVGGQATTSLRRHLGDIFHRVRTRHPRLVLGLAAFLVLNAVLLSLYVWSRGGQTTQVRIEAQGNQFTVSVDGRLRFEEQFEAPAAGGLILELDDTTAIPSLPEPRGIDSIRVSDFTTGDVLFEDDFSSGMKGEWKIARRGEFITDDGVLGVKGGPALTLLNRSWDDIVVDLVFKNITGARITVRAEELGTGVSYRLRPFRNLDDGLIYAEDREVISRATVGAGKLTLPRTETIKSLVAMTLRPYPLAALLLFVGFVGVAVLQFLPVRRLPVRLSQMPDVPWAIAASVTGSAFAVLLYLNYSVGSHMPHVPDAVSMIFEAKLLSSGRLAASAPPVGDAFNFFSPPFIVLSGDKWASIYPFGHPLVLAVGERVGAIWLIPPLIGAGSVLIVFAIAQKVYNARVAVAAAVLLASSPFFLMTASNFMAHNTAAFFILASTLCLVMIQKRPLLYGFLAGLFFGLIFNTRPLTGVALIPPFAILLLSFLPDPEYRIKGLNQIGAFILGGLLMLVAYWLYNFGTTGDAFTSGYQTSPNLDEVVGFGGRHSVEVGIQNEQTQLAFLLLVLNGWPQYVGLLFVLLPVMLPSRNRWDWFFLGSALCAMGAYTFFFGSGIMHGPRYWYEAAPFLMLLAARGADRAGGLMAESAALLRSTVFGGGERASWAGYLLTYALVGALVGGSIYGWLFSQTDPWRATFVPQNAAALDGFNGIDDRLTSLLDDADLDNALVLVEKCPNWQCYGNVFWQNSPDLDGDVVYARNLEERRAELFEAYPEREVYTATYRQAGLLPFGFSPPPGEQVTAGDLKDAPRATEIILVTPEPAPTPTPDPEAATRRDGLRVDGLATISEGLQLYFQRNGTYPLALGLQSFCRFRTLDAGCKVGEVLDPLPQEPGGGFYWYQSDGASFTLFAKLEGEADRSECPDPLPGTLRDILNLYCVAGSPDADANSTPSPQESRRRDFG